MAINMSPLMFMQIALENPALAAQYMAAQGKTPPPLETMANPPQMQTIPAMPQMQTLPALPEPRMTDQMLPMDMRPPAGPQAHGSTVQPNLEQTLPAMGDVPTAPGLPPVSDPMMSALVQSLLGQVAGDAAGGSVGAGLAPGTGERGPSGGQPYGVPAAPVQQAAPAAPSVVTTAAPGQLPALPSPTQIGALPVPPAAATAPVPAAASPGGPPTTPAAGPVTPMDAFAQSLLGLATPSGVGGGASRVGQAPAPYIQGALAPGTAAILQQILASAAQGPGQLNIRG